MKTVPSLGRKGRVALQYRLKYPANLEQPICG